MTPLLVAIYNALATLPCAVTRSWPQTLVPLPAIAFGVASAKTVREGVTQCTVRLEARAGTPEAADTLAASALGRMTALGFALLEWKDTEVPDGSCFMVTLHVSGAFGADGTPAPVPEVWVSAGGAPVPLGGILTVEPLTRERGMNDVTQPSDPVRRYTPQPLNPGRLTFTVCRDALDAGQALLASAMDMGTALTVTFQDPPNDTITAQGFVARISAAGSASTIVIQFTG